MRVPEAHASGRLGNSVRTGDLQELYIPARRSLSLIPHKISFLFSCEYFNLEFLVYFHPLVVLCILNHLSGIFLIPFFSVSQLLEFHMC
jgi:hypothetical protein